jgi:periplasmic protein TonB
MSARTLAQRGTINQPRPPPPPPPPPPPVKPTVKFTPPVIKKDEEVKEEEKPPEVKELDNKAVGLKTQEGDVNGIDPGINDKPGTGVVEAPPPPQIFTYVEQMPEFPGGDAARMKYLSENIHYPDAAREAGVDGKVIVKFVVSEDGSISDITVLRDFGYGSADEAKKVVSKMPKWKAGKQNGRPVKVYFTLPITFKLE